MKKSNFIFSLVIAFASIMPIAEAKTKSLPAKVPQKRVAAAAKQLPRSPASKAVPATATKPVAQVDKRIPAGMVDSNAALEVRGQSRNLSMMLVLKNKKDEIDFVKPRENYTREVQNTSY